MSIRLKVFLSFLCTIVLAVALIVRIVYSDLEPRYRQTIEEPLIDASRLIAAMIEVESENTQLVTTSLAEGLERAKSRPFIAQIYGHEKQSVDLRAYLTDGNGRVLYHSKQPELKGRDFSEWLDVRQTLAGEYGARTSRDLPENPDTSVMYVSAPIYKGNEIGGVLSLGKPTISFKSFIEDTKSSLVWSAVGCVLFALLIGQLLAMLLTGPIERLTGYARAVAAGRRVPLPALPRGEIGALGQAFEHMRESLEGKRYVERYVEALTHEIKSPLSAIRGAAELLGEPMEEADRAKFVGNIRGEAERMQVLIDKLLLLSQLEARKRLEDATDISLPELLERLRSALQPRLSAKRITLKVEGEAPTVRGDEFLIEQALRNLLDNAIDFSPVDGTIAVILGRDNEGAFVQVADNGPGIPEYALGRVFERFYSLARPGTERKSTGLGLSLVKEVAELHGGRAEILNGATGAVAVIRF